MALLSQGNLLSSDKPETDPEKDTLGYRSFAKYLADSLALMVPQEGLVAAIYAPWGSGKSTLLNFVRHYLQKRPEEQQPIVVPFNPWWFSGQEDLTRRFFDQLISTLGKQSKSESLRRRVARFAEAVGESGLPYTGVAKAVGRVVKPGERDIVQLKEQVDEALRESGVRLLVVIDDIDRLTAEEVRQMFRVVKAVADFPNVVYLLAFDKEFAAKSLETIQGGNGYDYLGKIVQVPFELPLPDSTALQQMLFKRLDPIVANTPYELFDAAYWSNVYRDGIHPFINTPRDVVFC